MSLILPRVVRQLRREQAMTGHIEMPSLDVLAARGVLERSWPASDAEHPSLAPWQRGLLSALMLNDAAADRFPYAATCAVALGKTAAAWLTYEFVHLVADLNQLSLAALEDDLQLDVQELAALAASCAAHFQNEHWTVDHRWIALPQPLHVQLANPQTAAYGSLREMMPQGRDGGAVRRMMTELQMMLHEHPVNGRREAAGLPTANAVWFWGAGDVSKYDALSLPPGFGTDPYLQGIYKLNERSCEPLPASAASIDLSRGAVIVVGDVPSQVIEERWLQPLLQALRNGRLARLEVVLDEWSIVVSWRDLLKVWRRPQPFLQQLA